MTPWGGGFSPLEFLYGFMIGLVAQMSGTAVLIVVLTVIVLPGLWCVSKGLRNGKTKETTNGR